MLGLGTMTDEIGFDEVRELILQIAELKNNLQEWGVIGSEDKITADYAKWFCSKKFGLELYREVDFSYDARSKFDERVQIKIRMGSDTDFTITFGGLCLDDFDYLFIVFMNKNTWMIDSIYKVSQNIVRDFLSVDPPRRFKWCGESRSLSLQMYPDEENEIFL